MGYLSRIHIVEVEEVGVDGVQKGANPHIVYLDGVVDYDNTPWEPVPGPDPWDALVVASDTYWSNLNDYSPGSEIFAHPAIYIGGDPDNTTYRYRWQYKAEGSGSWVNSSWTNYDNGVMEVSFFIPNTAAGGQVRLMSQARDTSDPDNTVQVNSFAPAEDVAYMPLVVSATTVSGYPYVNATATCAQPAVTGGQAPYTYSYMWLDQEVSALSPSNTTTLTTYDVGKVVNCYVSVTSADGQSANTTTTNGIGPVQAAPIMTPVVQKVNGGVVDGTQAIEISAGTHNLEIIANAIPPDIQYQWSLRTGTGTLTKDPNDPSKATYTTGDGDVAPLIATTLDSNISENTSVSWQLFVL